MRSRSKSRGAATHSAGVTRAARLGWIVLFGVIAARIARNGQIRVLAPVTLGALVIGLFGGELLDPIGVRGIWFPFGIGVSRTQYADAVVITLLAVLILRCRQHGSIPEPASEASIPRLFTVTRPWRQVP